MGELRGRNTRIAHSQVHTDDVWETLGCAAAGLIESYSDMAEVINFYRDADGGCVIVASDAAIAQSKPCGARSGC